MIFRLLMCCAGLLFTSVTACVAQSDVGKETEKLVEQHRTALAEELIEQHKRVNERFLARVERDMRRAGRNVPVDQVHENAVAAINAISPQALAASLEVPKDDPRVIAMISAIRGRPDIQRLLACEIAASLRAKAQECANVLALQEKPAAERTLEENYELARAGCKYFGAVVCSAGAKARDVLIKPVYHRTRAVIRERTAAALGWVKSLVPVLPTAAAAA